MAKTPVDQTKTDTQTAAPTPVNPYDIPAPVAAAQLAEGQHPSAPVPPHQPIVVDVEAPTHKKVILQRPPGVTDSHMFIGFNNFEGQFPYDTEISLPIEVINHLRAQRRVDYRAGDNGLPMASYSNSIGVMDVY